ncbi:hypothetical protein BDV24DRAFT_145633 [Aspergillus arachidicola]|uniref:Uncharacterized protein n=1 Tax=Aspergillus arachidicola TaxID=656916 RepID=A0A5N6XR18_9EURO|nr:hypothetical protein BDV24DRAFT_145633 [Aspergillus arachidicola]
MQRPYSNTILLVISRSQVKQSVCRLAAMAHRSLWSYDTSSPSDASPVERRHIHYNDEVMQCIAVQVEDSLADNDWNANFDDDAMLKQVASNSSTGHESTRSIFSDDSKTIAPLPPTVRKRCDLLPSLEEQPIEMYV